jgi:hypothetical protein
MMTRKRKVFTNTREWFEALDKYNSEPFSPDRDQPTAPERVIFEDDKTEGRTDA